MSNDSQLIITWNHLTFTTLGHHRIAERICAPQRLNALMADLRKRSKANKDVEQYKINELTRQLKKTEEGPRNLYAAIENGLPFDKVLQKRAQELKSGRESLLIELASVRRTNALPVKRVSCPVRSKPLARPLRSSSNDTGELRQAGSSPE